MSPGDEVVCVAAEWRCEECRRRTPSDYALPSVGQHYIVAEAASGHCGNCGHRLPAIRTAGCPLLPGYAWPMSWFRPLDYDEDQEIEDAGVTLPVRLEPVPA